MSNPPPHRIGLALGSGSARGWAHIGVIRGLREAGIEPDIVCGTSIGALVGAAYANNDLDRLAQWVKGLTWQAVVGFMDFSLNGGMIKGQKLVDFFRHNFVDLEIPRLPRPFAAVTTDLGNGRELWLRDGLVSDAVRASIALPGLFTPVERDGRLLVDGGLVNPVPVSLCRAMGADIVIAVDLNADLLGRRFKATPTETARPPALAEENEKPAADSVMARIQASMAQFTSSRGTAARAPAMLDVLATSINIMQVLITRSRLAGEPADVMITPLLADLGLLDFHKGDAAIDAGRRAVEAAMPQIGARLLNGLDDA